MNELMHDIFLDSGSLTPTCIYYDLIGHLIMDCYVLLLFLFLLLVR